MTTASLTGWASIDPASLGGEDACYCRDAKSCGQEVRRMKVEVLGFRECPNLAPTVELVRRIAERVAPGASIEVVLIETPEQAEAAGFLGSPSVRVNGHDIEGKSTDRGGLCCRTYGNGSGVPPEHLVESALRG